MGRSLGKAAGSSSLILIGQVVIIMFILKVVKEMERKYEINEAY